MVELLSRTDVELFAWDDEDLIDCDPQVKVIRAPLDVAKNLYPELQGSYLRKNLGSNPSGLVTPLSSSQTKAEHELATSLVPCENWLESATSPSSDSVMHFSPDLGYQSLEEKVATFGFVDLEKNVDYSDQKETSSTELGNAIENVTTVNMTSEDDLLTLDGYSKLVITDSPKDLFQRGIISSPLELQEDEPESTTTYDIPMKPDTGYSVLARPTTCKSLPRLHFLTLPLTAKSQQKMSHHESNTSLLTELVSQRNVHSASSNSYTHAEQGYESIQHCDLPLILSNHQQLMKSSRSLPHSLSHSCGPYSVSDIDNFHYEQIYSYERVQQYESVLNCGDDVTPPSDSSPYQCVPGSHAQCNSVPSGRSVSSPYDQIQSYEKVQHSTDFEATLVSMPSPLDANS